MSSKDSISHEVDKVVIFRARGVQKFALLCVFVSIVMLIGNQLAKSANIIYCFSKFEAKGIVYKCESLHSKKRKKDGQKEGKKEGRKEGRKKRFSIYNRMTFSAS